MPVDLPNEWPNTIPFDEISVKHPDYDPAVDGLGLGKLRVHSDLYEGGSSFRKNIESYLDKRQLEDASVATLTGRLDKNDPNTTATITGAINAAKAMRDRRKAISRYIPIVAGKFDWMVAATHQARPRIVAAEDNAKKPKLFDLIKSVFVGRKATKSSYWNGLNKNADGKGTDLAKLSRQILLSVILHKRGYFALNMPGTKGEYPDLKSQKESGDLDANIIALTARDIDDWNYDTNGKATYFRRYTCTEIKETPWAKPTGKRHVWTYFTDTHWHQYAVDVLDTHKGKLPDAELKDSQAHGFKEIPIIPVKIEAGLWLMERLREGLLSLFNRQASKTWSLNQMAWSLLTIAGGEDGGGQVSIDPESGALTLPDGGLAKFINPDPSIWDALQGDIKELKESVDDTMQAAALSAAGRDTQGRQSGVAKFRDFGSIATLLESYGGALRDSIEQVIGMLREARGDTDILLALEGLDKFDIQSIELKTKLAEAALKLPTGETFKRWILSSLQLSMANEAPAEVRQAILEEALNNPLPEPPTPTDSNPTPQAPEIRDPKTKQVVLNPSPISQKKEDTL